MVKYMKGGINKLGNPTTSSKQTKHLIKISFCAGCIFFTTTNLEELAASTLPVIPQAYCTEHMLGPHGQVTVAVCVAVWEAEGQIPV